MEDRKATLLFNLCNGLNAILCFFSIIPLGEWHPLLPFVSPYLYFAIRLGLYWLWYRLGYHPLPRMNYIRGTKGGIYLPAFTKSTEEYKQNRQQQSRKYQIIYNLYKVGYRTIYFTFLMVAISVMIHKLFTADNRYLGSPLENMLMNLSGGHKSIEKILFVALFVSAWLVFVGVYKLGRTLWLKHFYKRYPVTILVMEREEPILTVKEKG